MLFDDVVAKTKSDRLTAAVLAIVMAVDNFVVGLYKRIFRDTYKL